MRRDVPIAKSTWIYGIPKEKWTSFVGNLANMRPTPPESSTVRAAVAADLWNCDWKQITIFPLTKVAFRVPDSQLLLRVHVIRIFIIYQLPQTRMFMQISKPAWSKRKDVLPRATFICIKCGNIFPNHNRIKLVQILFSIIKSLTLFEKMKLISRLYVYELVDNTRVASYQAEIPARML